MAHVIFGVLLFLIGAAVAWVFPVGPMYWALGWTPLLLVAALLALLFVGLSSDSRITLKKLRPSPSGDGSMVVESRPYYGLAVRHALMFFIWFLTGFIVLSLIFGFL